MNRFNNQVPIDYYTIELFLLLKLIINRVHHKILCIYLPTILDQILNVTK